MTDSAEKVPQRQDDPWCPFCRGSGRVSGVVDDVEFLFECHCSGGNEEAVRWLLGSDVQAPPGEEWII